MTFAAMRHYTFKRWFQTRFAFLAVPTPQICQCLQNSYLFKCSQQYVRVAEMFCGEKRKWTHV